MIALGIAIAVALLAVMYAYVAPQSPVVHYGWASVAVAAIGAWGWYRSRPRTMAAWLAIAGVAALAFAFVANGLLAPDSAEILGAPGQDVAVPDDGVTIRFPLVDISGAEAAIGGRPQLVRGSSVRDIWPIAYTVDRRYEVLRRTVVYVRAYDARGGSLTITQPTGSVFLSPVLLMTHTQTIAGLDVPFDSFAVPAAHRLVKAVYFTAAQTSAMRGAPAAANPNGSVLFAVDDQNDVPLPHGIALAPAGTRVTVGGVTLSGTTLPYPQIRRSSIPNAFAVIAGVLCLLAAALVRIRSRS